VDIALSGLTPAANHLKICDMADLYPPSKQRPELLAFAAAGSARLELIMQPLRRL
jgi:hypothetical protein